MAGLSRVEEEGEQSLLAPETCIKETNDILSNLAVAIYLMSGFLTCVGLSLTTAGWLS